MREMGKFVSVEIHLYKKKVDRGQKNDKNDIQKFQSFCVFLTNLSISKKKKLFFYHEIFFFILIE